MLVSILFLMLGLRLEMSVAYYIVLAFYFIGCMFKLVWNLVKDDYIKECSERIEVLEEMEEE